MIASSQTYLDAVDAKVAARALLTHPFYQCWTRGELSPEALRDYAAQYYHHVAAFPTYLSALHSHTDDAVMRRHILGNLIDEEAGNPNHPELWLQFAETLGLSRDQVQNTALWEETRNLIETYRSICRDASTVEGIAALYAYESQIPAVAESKIDGLTRHYGVTDPAGTAYFAVHIEADKEHSRVERELLTNAIDGASAPAVMRSVDRALDSLWEMLSGVCRRHQIAMAC